MEFAARFTHAANPRLTCPGGYTQHAPPRGVPRASNLCARPGIRRDEVTRARPPRQLRRTCNPRSGGDTMPIVTTCRHCGDTFTADQRAILAGAWRLCPACQEPRPVGPTIDSSPTMEDG